MGAVANYKFIYQKLPSISGLAEEKITQFDFRFVINEKVDTAVGD